MLNSTPQPLTTASPRIVIGMSGGIDSTAAALLLKQQGYDVIGITLKLWEYESCDNSSKCCTPEDVRDARQVAAALNIPFYVRDFRQRFADEVVDYFTQSYLRGQTPNPCTVCNDKIKFKLLDVLASQIDAELLGTGHYARKIFNPSTQELELHRGVDPSRDQSYFLFRLNQALLQKLIFPLGDLQKSEVRELLRQAGVGRADKPESREICFVENGNFASFIEKRAPEKIVAGNFVNAAGEVLGQHQGLHQFTLGQRKGLGVASPVADSPYYVIELRPQSAEVVLGYKADLLKTGCDVEQITLISAKTPPPTQAEVVLRYRGTPIPVDITWHSPTTAHLTFLTGKEVPAPGQAAVLYAGSQVLGGGFISK